MFPVYPAKTGPVQRLFQAPDWTISMLTPSGAAT